MREYGAGDPVGVDVDLSGLAGLGGPEVSAGPAFRVGGRAYKRSAFYVYGFNFGGSSIAAGGSRGDVLRLNTDSDFMVEAVNVEVRTTAVIGSAVAGTALADVGETESGAGELPTLGAFRLDIRDTEIQWSNVPIPVSLWTGRGTQAGYTITKPVIPAGSSVRFEAFNDSGIDAVMWVGLIGTKLYR